MLLHDTRSGSIPPRVILEELPEGQRVLLSSNVHQVEDEDSISYEYDEVIFLMPSDRTETIQTIETNFDSWWKFGQQEAEDEISLEQRVSDLEDIIISLMEDR